VRARRPKLRDDVVTLAHGAGGKATRALVEAIFVDQLSNPVLEQLADSGVAGAGTERIALTTDSYVVTPLFFPGGDIGELAVNGTVNDLAVVGARPLFLAAGFVIEEGFAVTDLRRVAESMARAAQAAGVSVIAGDTKVVERGKADGLFICTSGVGVVPEGVHLGPERVERGDRVLLSGTIGDHGMAVMMARGGLALEADLRSDTAGIQGLAASLAELGDDLRFMRDPTRGGVATALNELATASGKAVVLQERALPVRPEVTGACEILGIDPLYVANEGKLIAVVSDDAFDEALARLRRNELGRDAALVGEIREEPEGMVLLETTVGGSRIVDMLVGDPLPRIC
jgi:hydrogenase expression/formation protein HypE